jgi:hypothetical protein
MSDPSMGTVKLKAIRVPYFTSVKNVAAQVKAAKA